ncbi:uncharacterized protein BDW47DRAFT_134666 [Aspergillus candidus]|uniref:Aminoglycoside phosphotransferase domain-containing protein n=1 Tax=Aspergillus candidus TaxID=41067 RepID=A0A2I2F0C1_ASPCN|nr:hypothetical protein BDW47DRAFT_134666 [Aspergillus candidus]PLB34074.1 hypothetical protein BDW47DRAFT_134666 [Aspergillus candidus]
MTNSSDGKTLFPCPSSVDIATLPADQGIITVLSKQIRRIILEGVRPAEAEAMKLVSKHTSVPVPGVFSAKFGPDHGNEKSKESVCLQTWDLISQIRAIPRPSELEDLLQCAADGSTTRDPMLEDLQNPAIPLTNDSGLRARIVERYLHFEGRRYEHQLHDMLPRSGSTVFTQADIAPRNIMIDEQNSVTGIPRPALWGDWSVWMDRTAPRRWNISGIDAARRVLF